MALVCVEIPEDALHRVRACDECGGRILRHEPRFMWLPDARALQYDNPPWSYRHVTCGSPEEAKETAA